MNYATRLMPAAASETLANHHTAPSSWPYKQYNFGTMEDDLVETGSDLMNVARSPPESYFPLNFVVLSNLMLGT